MVLLLLCLFALSSCLFGMWLYIIYVCECLMYLSVGGLVVNCFTVHNQTSHRQVHQALIMPIVQEASTEFFNTVTT